MKIHITNLYNFNRNDMLVEKQHRIAEAGIALGYREMGIFSFPVETDTPQELSKRLDGIIAALENEDVVFLQLPTRNGAEYEKLLALKCKAYRNTKLILMFHDMSLLEAVNGSQESYRELCKMADAVMVPTERDLARVHAIGVSVAVPLDDLQMIDSLTFSDSGGYDALRNSDFYIQKAMMDAVEAVFDPENKNVRSNRRNVPGEIHIGFGLHDKNGGYSVWVGVAIQSVIEHTGAPLCFHILHDETLNRKNRNRLIRTATQNGNRIVFHAMDNSCWKNSQERMGRYTVGAMFRILLPEILGELDKIIYLDADILVNRDIRELWELDMQPYCLAAVPDHPTVNGMGKPYPVAQKVVSANHYFNSGVLLMNLDRIRAKGNMCEKVLDYLEKNPQALLPDQDALNVIYGAETYLLDETWNTFTTSIWTRPETPMENRIYHFAVSRMILYSMSELDKAYYETLCRTPWGAEEGRKQMQESFSSTDRRLRRLEKVITLCSGSDKKHIFYGKETTAMKNIYHMLTIREGDYRVLGEVAEERNSILPCRPLTALAEEKEEFIVFVLPDADGWTSIAKLEKMGLVREKDYFEIPLLLPPNRGGYV